MKALNNLDFVTGGEQEYAVTSENYQMFLDFAKIILEDSPSFEINNETSPGWKYAPIYLEARPDKNFEKSDVDFILNVGIKLRKLED